MLHKRTLYSLCGSIAVVVGLIFALLEVGNVSAADSITISGPTSTISSVGVATLISDLQLVGNSASTTPVKLLVTNGTLAFGTTTGLTFTGGQTGSTLNFSGTIADINAALQTLTYTRNSTGSDTLEISLVQQGEVFFGDNGHLYKFISGSISWTSANSAAQLQTAYGVSGYLATILSQAENDFVAARLQGDGWMGASDAAQEGTWRWVTGPETGTHFWTGTGGGSAVDGNYENWASGEPNDSGGEDCGQFYVTNGTWNDLPCGFSISGYVVEFGTPGNLPGVAGKNISITTVAAPTLSSRSPLDNATNVAVEPNLTMIFSSTVVTSTGYIELRKTSDNSLVEQISVASSQITGGGTNTITINPSAIFEESTGYYVLVSSTAFQNNSAVAYAGISNATAWNFTTGDFTAPVITSLVATPYQTSSTLSWTTNELASTRVFYGVTQSITASTTETDTSPRVLSHEVSLPSLLPCTVYYYAVQSRDGSSNTATSSRDSFMTTGCQGTPTASSTTSTPITTTSGGTSGLTTQNTTFGVTVPTNITTSSDSVVIQINALEGNTVLPNIGIPNNYDSSVGPIVFDVKAIINNSIILDSFDAPVTISYAYSDEDIVGLDEKTLKLYHYHNGIWQELQNCVTNMSANTISCTTDSFSIFGLFGDEIRRGGGNMYVPPSIPQITKGASGTGALEINEGAVQTTVRAVNLSINASNAVQMSISEDVHFVGDSFIPFVPSYPYTLSQESGIKTVYVKLRSSDGGTIVISDTINLVEVETVSPHTLVCAANMYLTKPVRYGYNNNTEDVALLEKFLNTYENARLTVNGVYEKADFDAVVRWQEKYASAVLTPWGIQNGTGYIYTTSLAKIKEIHEKGCMGSTEGKAEVPLVVSEVKSTCLVTEQTLSYGMNNDAVKIAQNLLNKTSYLSHTATGFFGPLTKDAVVRFQKAFDIDQVGYIGPKTRTMLNQTAKCVE